MSIKQIFFLIFLCFSINFVFGQDTILMGTNNHQSIVSDYVVLYADNGPGQLHSTRVDASYTIKATDSTYNCKIIIRNGNNYSTYSKQNNKYVIYDGDTSSTDVIYSSTSVQYTMYYELLNNGEVTIKFHVDNDNPPESFEIIIQFCDCQTPSDITHEYIDSTSVMFRWDGHGYSSFAVDYILYPPPVNSSGTLTAYRSNLANPNSIIHTVYSNTDSVLITGLPPYSFIHYDVYGSCDSVPMCGVIGNTDCRNFTPENIEVTYDEDSIHFTWDTVSDANWYINTNSTGWVLTTDNHYSITKTCNATTSVRITGGYGGFFWCNVDYLLNKYFGCPRISPTVTDVTYNSARVYWTDIDTIDYYLVVCTYNSYPYDTVFYDTVPRGVQEAIMTGLDEATQYKVNVFTLCEECGKSPVYATRSFTTSIDRCIDYINLNSDNVHPSYGVYENPYMYNYYSSSRHSVIVDKNSTDYYTNYLLKQVPEGEKASIKLGNSSTGAEAESISYDYSVDTNQFDMLTLKYAVVLQNPDHTLENQPRFTLEILDNEGNLIDSTCAFADFYASGELGWNQNTYNNSTIIWKDWTTVGVDIAPYHGEDIKIRLTTYDCKDGGHFGYAYFTLNCDKKRIYLYNPCDAIDSIHLRAPLGFEYKWYREGDTTILSTNYDILVPVDSNEYFCTASFVGKPECNFTISSHSISLYPKAIVDFTIDTCNSTVYLNDLSYMIFDTSYNVFTNHILDTSYWILENDSVIKSDSLIRFYPDNGTYNLQLVSSITDSYCRDTIPIPVTIDFNLLSNILGPDTVCQRDTVVLSANFFDGFSSENIDYLWNNNETNDSIMFVADSTKEWSLNISENGSCRGAAMKKVIVNPSYHDTIFASICDNQVYNDEWFNVDSAGIYTWIGTTDCNCDSIKILVLDVHPTYDTLIFDTICYGEQYTNFNFNTDSAGIYTQHLQSINGCDSIVTLNLHVSPTHDTTINAEICDNETYTLNGFIESESGVYTHNEVNIYECDSIFTLNLTVHPTYNYTIDAEICQGETYNEHNFTETETGIHTQHLQTIHGCDSTVNLDLIVHPSYNYTMEESICGGVYDENGFYQEESGLYTQHHQTEHGCDSIVNLDLTIFNLFVDTLNISIYEGDAYEYHGFNETQEGEYIRVFTDANGCDSTYILFLDVVHLMIPNMVSANGDGINDVFEIKGLLNNNYFYFVELSIYNRHGRVIYYKNEFYNKEDFWSPEETDSPDGTYFYKFRAMGKTKIIERQGAIEVLR